MFTSLEDIVKKSQLENKPVSELMIEQEVELNGVSRTAVEKLMKKNLMVMMQAVEEGIAGVSSKTGLTGGDAKKIKNYIDSGKSITGADFLTGVAAAVATNEVNASLGLICATPTAGSAGVLPGCVHALKEKFNIDEETQLRMLFTAGAFGFVVANNASCAGAEGGCQAEIGSASAMAAAAIVEAMGGDAAMSAHAFAIAMKNMLGLVCDPVAGLVEVPCVKRNAAGASIAMMAADLALAGVESRIPADEVLEAMYKIGLEMSTKFKETAKGGLAITATGERYRSLLFGND
ncbi:L-serine dehydratase, iron-sulfur-dependent, alpha subunit [Gemella bergeri ATCC 700627]|uniref:L-serine dehydratase n=1 Tax=Gemella bergeri ATCC 700627 TaxID=1321820 RepID=U2RS29_9BACL|nr:MULTISPECIES: L-serine ammonia-lyase, iron-sulfur-dependent, subunit alpha [Gemella]AME09773.1 serine dehydratase [Gemella sp. oral taxon 928]AXI27372.1 L-serine ammonia-lyase, iron-sulfur-dependent, subunit alpha [Gemella sp. ND 6198]ERK56348.1 L-serine dehydratase, iron-sulfur-dependent, alpha subunit [Gemella bergeri ATCC 700627]